MSELQFEFSSFHMIIILLIIAGLSVYFYYELTNIKSLISEINKKIQSRDLVENKLTANSTMKASELNTGDIQMTDDYNNNVEMNNTITTDTIGEVSNEVVSEIINEDEINNENYQGSNLVSDEESDEDSNQESDEDSNQGSNEESDEDNILKLINSDDSDEEKEEKEEELNNEHDEEISSLLENNDDISINTLINSESFMEELGNLSSDNVDKEDDLFNNQELTIEGLNKENDLLNNPGLNIPENEIDKYNNLSIKELKDIIQEKNLLMDLKISISGNKTTLIERIIDNQ